MTTPLDVSITYVIDEQWRPRHSSKMFLLHDKLVSCSPGVESIISREPDVFRHLRFSRLSYLNHQ